MFLVVEREREKVTWTVAVFCSNLFLTFACFALDHYGDCRLWLWSWSFFFSFFFKIWKMNSKKKKKTKKERDKQGRQICLYETNFKVKLSSNVLLSFIFLKTTQSTHRFLYQFLSQKKKKKKRYHAKYFLSQNAQILSITTTNNFLSFFFFFLHFKSTNLTKKNNTILIC